jgi:hypothetical protein
MVITSFLHVCTGAHAHARSLLQGIAQKALCIHRTGEFPGDTCWQCADIIQAEGMFINVLHIARLSGADVKYSLKACRACM